MPICPRGASQCRGKDSVLKAIDGGAAILGGGQCSDIDYRVQPALPPSMDGVRRPRDNSTHAFHEILHSDRLAGGTVKFLFRIKARPLRWGLPGTFSYSFESLYYSIEALVIR